MFSLNQLYAEISLSHKNNYNMEVTVAGLGVM